MPTLYTVGNLTDGITAWHHCLLYLMYMCVDQQHLLGEHQSITTALRMQPLHSDTRSVSVLANRPMGEVVSHVWARAHTCTVCSIDTCRTGYKQIDT